MWLCSHKGNHTGSAPFFAASVKPWAGVIFTRWRVFYWAAFWHGYKMVVLISSLSGTVYAGTCEAIRWYWCGGIQSKSSLDFM